MRRRAAAPVTLIIFAGALNGLILPIDFGVLLWAAARRRELFAGYRYPRWLLVIGALAWALTVYMGLRLAGGALRTVVLTDREARRKRNGKGRDSDDDTYRPGEG